MGTRIMGGATTDVWWPFIIKLEYKLSPINITPFRRRRVTRVNVTVYQLGDRRWRWTLIGMDGFVYGGLNESFESSKEAFEGASRYMKKKKLVPVVKHISTLDLSEETQDENTA